jgi:hypothetical protein
MHKLWLAAEGQAGRGKRPETNDEGRMKSLGDDHTDPAFDEYGPAMPVFGIERVRSDLEEIREMNPTHHSIVNICNVMLNYISYVERTYEHK